jgi:hypothetical protein
VWYSSSSHTLKLLALISIKTSYFWQWFLEDHQPYISKLMINNWNISQKEFANRKISKISEQSKLTDQCDTHSLVCFRSGKKYKIFAKGEREK